MNVGAILQGIMNIVLRGQELLKGNEKAEYFLFKENFQKNVLEIFMQQIGKGHIRKRKYGRRKNRFAQTFHPSHM